MSQLWNAYKEVFAPIAEEIEKIVEPPTLPFRVSPFNYAGLGSFEPEGEDVKMDIIHYLPTLPTMTIEAKRDLITGEIIGYHDLPISTDTEDSGLNRPIGSADDYVRGGTNAPFTPNGIHAPKKIDSLNMDEYLAALNTHLNLLSSPFTEEKIQAEAALPELPTETETTPPTAVPDPWQTDSKTQENITATYDTFDCSKFSEEVPHPACEFSYKLDDFQLRSIVRLEKGEPVFVSAPTSAGKTVIAQYAIALCKSHKMRAIYTSPIKALSNQKYRDFTRMYGEVGILTGDVSLNRDAPILIMTTEILRQMLYRGADVLRDVECVIFDECHYISDAERGVVWEESIIMMPEHINMVFLSATAPNDLEIASWIARTKQKPVWIERHEIRPVPLAHALYLGNQFFQLSSGDRPGFNSDNYAAARKKLSKEKVFDKKGKKIQRRYQPSFWISLVKKLKDENYLPALMFSFSQKNVEKLGNMCKGIKLVTDAEIAYIRAFMSKALARIAPEDRELPQIKETCELLYCGIGLHHGGMIPLLKESVEILLADGYLKILFCTSTFAMGINVPARTCVFTDIMKFNGKEMERLTPTEYVQMSGRAGRRGLDTVGHAILAVTEELPDETYLQNIVKGKSGKLESHFYVRFNMVLNLVRAQGIDMIDLLKQSLSANAVESKIPKFKEEIAQLDKVLAERETIDCAVQDIEDATPVANILMQMTTAMDNLLKIVGANNFIGKLKPGTIVFVTNRIFDLAVVQRVGKYISVFAANGITANVKPHEVCAIIGEMSYIDGATKLDRVKESLIAMRGNEPIPYSKIFGSYDMYEYSTACRDLHRMYHDLMKSPCFKCSHKVPHVTKSIDVLKQQQRRNELKKICDGNSESFALLLKGYVDMLTELGYIENDVITLKGRVSIEIVSVANEIQCTELLCNNFFDDMTPVEIAAVTSALVGQRNGKEEEEEIKFPPEIDDKMCELEEHAMEFMEIMGRHDIEYEEESWLTEHVNKCVVMPTYIWAMGNSFAEVMKKASQFQIRDGGMIRTIAQTADLLTQFGKGAKLLGNTELADKFDESAALMKRGIIFSASLYLD